MCDCNVFENDSVDKKDVELNDIVKKVIFNKPEKHSFSIKEVGYINNRFMNSTGG